MERDPRGDPVAGDAMPPALSPQWALFLDIDGTLVEIEERPDAVRIDDSLKALLRDLSIANGGALALISGRSVGEIDRMLAPLRLPVAGQHGAERRSADGALHHHGPLLDSLHQAAEKLSRFAARRKGLIVENKGMSLALHYRLAPRMRKAAEARMRELASQLGPDYAIQEGKAVLELKPTGRDKGSAIAEFMQEPPFAGRVPVFIGDDLTDDFGFARVNRLGGHSVKVGPGPSAATWRLADAGAVRRWLRNGLQQRQEPGTEDGE
jgi:trehalose 6-phosphate phosphatase